MILKMEEDDMAYNTEQKKSILDFLSRFPDSQFTADEIAQALSGEVGKSTAYRQLTALAESGGVRRYVADGSRKAMYQALGSAHCDSHLHLKCVSCGKLIHMSDGISERLVTMIKNNSDFAVDETDTVLLGRCSRCVKANK